MQRDPQNRRCLYDQGKHTRKSEKQFLSCALNKVTNYATERFTKQI